MNKDEPQLLCVPTVLEVLPRCECARLGPAKYNPFTPILAFFHRGRNLWPQQTVSTPSTHVSLQTRAFVAGLGTCSSWEQNQISGLNELCLHDLPSVLPTPPACRRQPVWTWAFSGLLSLAWAWILGLSAGRKRVQSSRMFNPHHPNF